MIQIPNHTLSKIKTKSLRLFQNEIDAMATFTEKVEKAKEKWNTKNNTKLGKNVFTSIKVELKKMCPTENICCYCEFSEADEIEHIFPKTLYPEKTFAWENYLLSCGICNLKKSNKFTLFTTSTISYEDITPPNRRSYIPIPPPLGQSVMINIRTEDPTEYIILDFSTFLFIPSENFGTMNYLRADYTITLLELNRPALVNGRRNMFGSYKNMLSEYLKAKSRSEKNRIKKEVLSANHKTVWHEMQRQCIWFPDLKELFDKIPDALLW